MNSASVSRRTTSVRKEGALSIVKQCQLLGIPRSMNDHKAPSNLRLEDELIMQAMERIYMGESTFGSRRMRNELENIGYTLRRYRLRRLMCQMGIESIYSPPRLCMPGKERKTYPYTF